MAASSVCVWWLQSQRLPQQLSHSNFPAAAVHNHSRNSVIKGLGRNRSFTVSSSSRKNIDSNQICDWTNEASSSNRRELLLQALFAAFSVPAMTDNSVALAESEVLEDEFRVYSDDVNKFKISIPRDWQVGNGEGDGIRSLTAFYPQDASSSNVSVVITGLGPDFTRLESFGKVDAFAENLVSGLDRSWQRPPGVTAKLVDCKAANGLYYIEYTLQNPGESRRRLFSVLGIANNGWYNRLYTLTGQFVDEEAEKYGPKIKKAIASFQLIRGNS
ncbi:hypothetical protein M9H77_20199 [Catharanthus roseus]|uniref:Uncharacterized protein n=1 Tax=Catharanthus roseus TaxID=4058 RepID=A0ACC0AJU5_CATRO|nr:hypothetical protein M9H77_20199 [Catharanthus roseus]